MNRTTKTNRKSEQETSTMFSPRSLKATSPLKLRNDPKHANKRHSLYAMPSGNAQTDLRSPRADPVSPLLRPVIGKSTVISQISPHLTACPEFKSSEHAIPSDIKIAVFDSNGDQVYLPSGTVEDNSLNIVGNKDADNVLINTSDIELDSLSSPALPKNTKKCKVKRRKSPTKIKYFLSRQAMAKKYSTFADNRSTTSSKESSPRWDTPKVTSIHHKSEATRSQAKPSDSLITAIDCGEDTSYCSMLNQYGSKCTLMNICNQMNGGEPDRLPTPTQSCCCAAKAKMQFGNNGRWALEQLRQLHAARTDSDLLFKITGTPAIKSANRTEPKGMLTLVIFFCLIIFALLVALTLLHLEEIVQLVPGVVRKYFEARFGWFVIEVKPDPTLKELYWEQTMAFADKFWQMVGHLVQNVIESLAVLSM